LTDNTSKTVALDKRWHLAENEHEILVADLELAVMRISAAFDRWQKDCMSCCTDLGLSGIDNAVLHMIRMHDRPKGISEIARLMNRDDISNLQYSLRKLLNSRLIERSGKKDSKRSASYIVTEEGRQITDKFAGVRQEILISLVDSIKDLDENMATACKVLNMVAGLYDQAAAMAATHQRN
jgi:predicted MarR family transcription regulator